MSYVSKTFDWEIFNIPPIHPVQYYSVLKKKREFSQLIRQYDTQVYKHGYLHYCGIVPKNISSSLNNKYEILIVFFDEVPSTSFIGFRVKVSQDTYIRESNSLLLFLKKSKAVFYLMNNNCIHVQCGTNAWELFYLLYDTYLRQYVLTVIGTQFFYPFVFSYCIQKEIQLLEILYKGSKIIRVSKKSIYYKIHQKRKISVSDLIHMTLNMPKSKRYVMSCFSSKEPLLYSNLEDGNFYTTVGSKINLSKLTLKKFKKQFQSTLCDAAVTNPVALEMVLAPDSALNLNSKSSVSKYKTFKPHEIQMFSGNTAMKRKFEEIEHDRKPSSSTSKFLKISNSNCTKINEDQWELYTNLKPFTVKSYSGVSFMNKLVPNLLRNNKSSHVNGSNLCSLKNSSHISIQSNILPSASLTKETDSKGDLTTQEACEIVNHVNLFNTTENESLLTAKNTSLDISNKLINAECSTSELISTNLQICHSVNNKPYSSQDIPFLDADIKAAISLSTSKNFNTSEYGSFTIVGGKAASISNNAMVTARRLLHDVFNDEKQQELHEKINYDPNKQNIYKKSLSFRNNESNLNKVTVNRDISLYKASVKPHSIQSFKGNEMTSEKFGAVPSESNSKNFCLHSIDSPEDVSFSTATGKTINVSNTAMQAAHKLIQDVFKEEKRPAPSAATNYDIPKIKICKGASAFKDIGCPSKQSIAEEIDVHMDETLVEKLFEDTLFDEEELEGRTDCYSDKNTDIGSEPKSDKNLPSRKPRKSLGGRRSMKFCSDKL